MTLAFLGSEAQLAKDTDVATAGVASGDCVALRVHTLGMTTAAYLNCTLERLPG